MFFRPLLIVLATSVGCLTLSAPSLACHEAVFGPHASFLYGAPSYVSLQTFGLAYGSGESATTEGVGTLSAGFTPSSALPLSLAVIQPLSMTENLAPDDGHDHSHREFGVEDTILGVGYRFELPRLARGEGGHGNFAALIAGAELPTGNVGHDPFDGTVKPLVSGILSLEFGALSTMAYAYHRMASMDETGASGGDLTYLGAGAGWTLAHGSGDEDHLSVDLGLSWEHVGPSPSPEIAGEGGWTIMAQPTVVWGPTHRWRLFASVGVPVTQDFEHAASERAWRAGVGVVWLLDSAEPSATPVGCGPDGCSPEGCASGCDAPAPPPTSEGCADCDAPTPKTDCGCDD